MTLDEADGLWETDDAFRPSFSDFEDDDEAMSSTTRLSRTTMSPAITSGKRRSAGPDPKKGDRTKKRKTGPEVLAEAVLQMAEAFKDPALQDLDKAVDLLDNKFSKPTYGLSTAVIEQAIEICSKDPVKARIFVRRSDEGRLQWLNSLVPKEASTGV